MQQRPSLFVDSLGLRPWVVLVVVAVLLLVVLGATMAAMVAVSWHGQHVACLRLHEQTEYPTRMAGSAWGGECYVDVDGRWVPADRYGTVNVSNSGE